MASGGGATILSLARVALRSSQLIQSHSGLTVTMGISRGTAAMEVQGFGGAFTPLGSARSVSSQILRMRMKSVTSIQKITKAMKMVAASKLRGVQVKAENSRGMWQPFTALLGDKPDVNVKKKVIVVVSTDKGLCGGINSTSVKYTRAMMKMNGLQGADKELKYVVIGEKAKAQLMRGFKKDITLFIGETQKISICFSQAALIADDILRTNKADAYHVVFNKFGSVVSFLPTVATILSPETLTAAPPGETAKAGSMDAYEVEGADMLAEALDNLLEFQFASLLYNAMLENATSESGARMSAMDNSSRNATDMLGKLNLTYNRGRQSTITTELIEIISGAAALEG